MRAAPLWLAPTVGLGQSPVVRLRRGIVIRLCLYLPVIGYLSWRAVERWQDEQRALSIDEAPKKQTIVLPDGSSQAIVELTPEQADALFGGGGEIKSGPPAGRPDAGRDRTSAKDAGTEHTNQ